MLWTSIPTNFTGSARPLKPRSGAVAIARSMPSSCVASVPAFLRTRPEGLELSLHARRKATARGAAQDHVSNLTVWRPFATTGIFAEDGHGHPVPTARRANLADPLGDCLVQPTQRGDWWMVVLLLWPALPR